MGAARPASRALIGTGLSFAVGVALVFAACGGGDDNGEARPELGSIRAVAEAARRDADTMERHADAMVAEGGATDPVQWRSDEEATRAAARSLRALADWADAILRSEALHPTSHRAVELNRLLGDGLNLADLGNMVVEHAGAMETHIAAMRERYAGTPEWAATLTALENNVGMMREDGQSAIEAGDALADQARQFARGIGATIE